MRKALLQEVDVVKTQRPALIVLEGIPKGCQLLGEASAEAKKIYQSFQEKQREFIAKREQIRKCRSLREKKKLSLEKTKVLSERNSLEDSFWSILRGQFKVHKTLDIRKNWQVVALDDNKMFSGLSL